MAFSIYQKALLVTTMVAGGFAHAKIQQNEQFLVHNTSVYSLDLEESSVTFNVPYPGHEISSICKIEIRSDSYNRAERIENFLKAVNIQGIRGNTVNAKATTPVTIQFDIPSGGYAYLFTIEAKDGRTLNETIKKTLGDSRTLILLGSTCPERQVPNTLPTESSELICHGPDGWYKNCE